MGIGYFLMPQTTDIAASDAIIVMITDDASPLPFAASLFTRNKAPLIIVLGATNEADRNKAKGELTSKGVPEDKLLFTDKAITIHDCAVAAEKIIDQRKLSKLILVTSNYQQRRLLWSTKTAMRVQAVTLSNAPAAVSYWSPFLWWTHQQGIEATFLELTELMNYWQAGYL
jgi:uncharacterized SAM-binding protein YcdF (DUF218 family)